MKAFYMVNSNELWTILRKLVYPLNSLILLIHADRTGEVLSDWEPSEKFNVANGIEQGLPPHSSAI